MRTLTVFSAWASESIDEIVFENRNKSYGAYDLRRHYSEHIKKALLFCSVSAILLAIVSLCYYDYKNRKIKTSIPPFLDTVIFETRDVIIIKRPTKNPSASPEKIEKTKGEDMIVAKDTIVDSETKDTTEVLQRTTSTAAQSSHGLDGISKPDEGGITKDDGASRSDSITIMDEVINAPTTWPTFPGGQKALAKYLQKNLDCPEMRSNGSKKMFLSFVVSKEGKIKNVEIVRDNAGCGLEAKRVMEGMPRWNVGTYNNHPVNVRMIIPITIEFAE